MKGLMNLVVFVFVIGTCVNAFGQTDEEKQVHQTIADDYLRSSAEARNSTNAAVEVIAKLVVSRKDADELFRPIELIKKQIEELSVIVAKYERDIESTKNIVRDPKQFGSTEDQISAAQSKLKRQLLADFNEVLLPHQLEYLIKMDITKQGLPKLLTESPVLQILELSDRQVEQIKRKSDELAARIEKVIHESRIEALDIVMNELTENQKGELFKLYSKPSIERQIATSPLSLLYSHYVYTLPEDFDERQSPLVNALFTNLRPKEKKRGK